jgi:hypothetical protein
MKSFKMDIPAEGDGFKWFGEGFDGFPKRLPDDCVEYIIHLIDTRFATAAKIRTRLNEILKASNDLKKKLLKDYVWQRDEFELKLFPNPSSTTADVPPLSQDLKGRQYLRGRTNFGDSIADEWLIVYLLLKLSKQFTDAWIRIYDTDGEFLLIEAANALPKWLNPEIAENRVWLNNGHLRIIPLDKGATSRNLSLQDALSFIEERRDNLIISPFIEDEAFYRIREYPSAISSSLHHALLTIPRRLAYILHRSPAYISPAIEAFYIRDPISVRPLTTKDISTLNFPPEDFVTVSVKFTKVGYAQLRSQIFDPPPAWTGVIPRMRDPKAEMGMKLACGFEMLLADPQNQDKRTVREIKLLLEDMENGDEQLPSDTELASWPQTQDDEKWLDIDFNDFENELSGKHREGKEEKSTGFGDGSAQENLRKMVSRVENFLKDDTAGVDGFDDLDEDDDASDSESGEDQDASFDETVFEKSMKEMMGMSSDQIEQSGLLDEARKLALEDAENQSDVDEDEEMRKVMDLMEKELKSHGALNPGNKAPKTDDGGKKKPIFGPERPPGMQSKDVVKRQDGEDGADEEFGPADGELSSDDEEFNDVDLGLAKNMLESFKGEAGVAGPAGNLMKALGVNMPRDEGDESD